jgi:hypothetical protein
LDLVLEQETPWVVKASCALIKNTENNTGVLFFIWVDLLVDKKD